MLASIETCSTEGAFIFPDTSCRSVPRGAPSGLIKLSSILFTYKDCVMSISWRAMDDAGRDGGRDPAGLSPALLVYSEPESLDMTQLMFSRLATSSGPI